MSVFDETAAKFPDKVALRVKPENKEWVSITYKDYHRDVILAAKVIFHYHFFYKFFLNKSQLFSFSEIRGFFYFIKNHLIKNHLIKNHLINHFFLSF